MSFAGKSLVITGGSTGLGLEIVRQCLRKGVSKVAILDIINEKHILALLSAQLTTHTTVIFLKTDVTNRANVRRSFEQAHTEFGAIDIVIGNAGIFDENQPERVISVNLLGAVHSTYAAIDLMHSAPAYTASKHGVVGLTRSFGVSDMAQFQNDFYEELHGIKFFNICPGQTVTRMLESMVNNLRGIGNEEIQFISKNTACQTAAECASLAVELLEEPKNGSILDGGQRTEVTMKTYWKQF